MRKMTFGDEMAVKEIVKVWYVCGMCMVCVWHVYGMCMVVFRHAHAHVCLCVRAGKQVRDCVYVCM